MPIPPNPEFTVALSALLSVEPAPLQSQFDAVSSLTEPELLRAIAVTCGRMFLAEHNGDLLERQRIKGELYALLITWRKKEHAAAVAAASANAPSLATASTLPPAAVPAQEVA